MEVVSLLLDDAELDSKRKLVLSKLVVSPIPSGPVFTSKTSVCNDTPPLQPFLVFFLPAK